MWGFGFCTDWVLGNSGVYGHTMCFADFVRQVMDGSNIVRQANTQFNRWLWVKMVAKQMTISRLLH
nr:hypothetical protein Iba_chr03fCG3240 [Ipomoea batatas]